MSLAVANQYAKALLEASSSPANGLSAEAALQQLDTFTGLVKESHELHNILLSPAIPNASKQKALARLSQMAGLAPMMTNFLMLVVRRRRLPLLAGIRERFQALLDESYGLVRADVHAAQPLSADEQSAIENSLARVTGKQVRCGYTVDDSLLGGVTVRVGSTMYDGSVLGQLEGLRRRLTGAA